MQYEYKVVPAPRKGRSGKGVRGTEAKFANELMFVMNDLGADGWEYVRSDTLPCEERSGLTSKTTSFQNILVFRRRVMSFADAPSAARPASLHAEEATEILAIPAPKEQNGILGVLRARKLSREDGSTTTYAPRPDLAAE